MIESTPVGASLFAAFILLAAVVVFYLPRAPEDRRAVLTIALVAFVVKAMLVPVYYWMLREAGLGGFGYPDTLRYHEWAIEMSTEIRFDLPRQHHGWEILSSGYYILCAYIYTLFGANTMLPRLLNVAISSMSLLYVYRIGKLYFEPRVARTAVLLTAFLPFSLLTVLEQRKDVIAQFLGLVAFYHGARALRLEEGWQRDLGWVLAALVPMYYVRSGFILLFLAIMFIAFVFVRRNLVAAIGAAIPALLIAGALSLFAPEDSRINFGRSVERLQGKAAQGEFQSQFIGLMRYAYISSPLEIWKAPLSGGLVMVTPFPPTLTASRLPALIGPWLQLFTLGLYPFVLVAVLKLLGDRERRDRLLLILYPALFLMVIGAVNPSVTRYREVVFPVVLLLAAYGLRLPRNPMSFVVVYGVLAIFGVFVYAFRTGIG